MSVNDFVVKAVAAALRAVPQLNVRISDDGSQVSTGIIHIMKVRKSTSFL